MRISDALLLKCLQTAKVVAGFSGCHNEITSVSVLEVSNEKIKNWVLEGQMYITSFYAISTNTELQKTVIRSLVEKHSSGLVLCHFDIILKYLSPEIIELCNELNFPLIIADSDITYVEIIEAIIQKLDVMKSFPEGLHETVSRFIDVINQFNDYRTMYSYIESIMNTSLIVLDTNNIVIYHGQTNDIEKVIEKSLTIMVADFQDECVFKIDSENWQRNYMFSNNRFYGVLIGKVENEGQSLMIRMLSKLSTLILEKKEKHKEIRKSQMKAYISDLLTWNFRSKENAISRGKDVGWDIEDTNQMIIININDFQSVEKADVSDMAKMVNEVMMPDLRAYFLNFWSCNCVYFYNDMIIILCSKKNKINANSVHKIVARVNELFDNHTRLDISIGISDRYEDVEDIPKKYKQATLSYKIARVFKIPDKFILYENIKHFSNILDKISPKNDLEEELFLLDPKMAESYYETIEALVLNDFNMDKTAEHLYLHKNTIIYRKNKLVELMKRNIFEMPYLFDTLYIVMMGIIKRDVMIQ